jgi:hypothetical protein
MRFPGHCLAPLSGAMRNRRPTARGFDAMVLRDLDIAKTIPFARPLKRVPSHEYQKPKLPDTIGASSDIRASRTKAPAAMMNAFKNASALNGSWAIQMTRGMSPHKGPIFPSKMFKSESMNAWGTRRIRDDPAINRRMPLTRLSVADMLSLPHASTPSASELRSARSGSISARLESDLRAPPPPTPEAANSERISEQRLASRSGGLAARPSQHLRQHKGLPVSTLHIDGSTLGRWAVRHMERTLGKPATGMTGVDPRAGLPRTHVSPF